MKKFNSDYSSDMCVVLNILEKLGLTYCTTSEDVKNFTYRFKDTLIKSSSNAIVYYTYNNKSGMCYRIVEEYYYYYHGPKLLLSRNSYSLNKINKIYYEKCGDDPIYKNMRVRQFDIKYLMMDSIPYILSYRIFRDKYR